LCDHKNNKAKVKACCQDPFALSTSIETSGFIYKNSSGKIEEGKMLWREYKEVEMRTENGSLFGMTYCKRKGATQTVACSKRL